MKMKSYKPRRKKNKWIPYVVLLVLAGVVVVYWQRYGFLYNEANPDAQSLENATGEGQTRRIGKDPEDDKSANDPAPGPKGMTKGLAWRIGSRSNRSTPNVCRTATGSSRP